MPTRRRSPRQQARRQAVVSIAGGSQPARQDVPRPVEPAFVALQTDEDLAPQRSLMRCILTGERWTAIRFSNRGLSSAWT